MFTKLCLENFLSFKGPVEIPLDKVTVVVGANNSGKTNLLTALRFLQGIVKDGFSATSQNLKLPIKSIRFKDQLNPQSEIKLFAGIPYLDGKLNCDYRIAFRAEEFPAIVAEICRSIYSNLDGSNTGIAPESVSVINGKITDSKSLVIGGKGNEPIFQRIIDSGHLENFLYTKTFYHHVISPKYFHFSAKALREPSLFERNIREMGIDGSGLPSVLDFLRDENPNVFKRIEDDFKRFVPEIENVLLKRTLDGKGKFILLKERSFKEPFPADQISDGLMLFLALITCVHTEPRPSLIMLEEPERGIHPRRIRDVVDLLHDLADPEEGEPVQFLLTTHSPYLIDMFKDSLASVLILEKGDQGTTVKRASEFFATPQDLQGVSLGEAWFTGLMGGVPK